MKEGWKMVKLGEVCESRLGKTLNSSTDIGKPYEYLCAVNIQWDKIDLSILKKTLFSNEEVEKFKIQKGDLLVCEGGEAGRAAIWDDEKTILYQNALHRIRFKNNVMLPRFCMHYLRKLKFEGIIDKNYARGATIKHLVTKSLYSIPIPLPPLEEQHRIVSILDASFEKIDALKKNAVENLKNAKALFQQVLAQELKPKEGWVEKKLGEVSSVRIGPFGSLLHKKDYIIGGTPLVNPVHMKNGVIYMDDNFTVSKEKEIELNNYILRTNDIVFARRGEIGRCALVTEKENGYLCGTGSLFVRFIEKVNSRFMLLMFQSAANKQYLIDNASGATMLNINSDIVMNMPICLPEIEEQHRIVATLDTLSEKCRRLEQVAQQTIRECDALKQSILRQAFSGEL